MDPNFIVCASADHVPDHCTKYEDNPFSHREGMCEYGQIDRQTDELADSWMDR